MKQKVWNEAENGERDWGKTLKIRTLRFAYVIFVRITRFSQPRAEFQLTKSRCKLSTSCQVMFSTSHSRYSVPWWIAKAFAVKWRILELVLKSEKREALELLLRGKDVFCVLPAGFDKSLIYQMFVHAKSSSSSVQRPTVIVISPG